eukprot:COSAG01_NODE_783_length_13630_cov_5.556459_19_plen_83_part_00
MDHHTNPLRFPDALIFLAVPYLPPDHHTNPLIFPYVFIFFAIPLSPPAPVTGGAARGSPAQVGDGQPVLRDEAEPPVLRGHR